MEIYKRKCFSIFKEKKTDFIFEDDILESLFNKKIIDNLELRQSLYKFPLCKLLGVPCPSEKKYENNIIDESIEQNQKRYNYGKLATEIFLNNVKIRELPSFKISLFNSKISEKTNSSNTLDRSVNFKTA